MAAYGNITAPSHLLFADDAIIFAKAKIRGLRKLVQLIDDYERMFEQAINRSKSHFFLGGTRLSRGVQISSILNTREGHLPKIYLGVPLVIGRVTKSTLAPLIDCFKNRINSWQGRMIALQG